MPTHKGIKLNIVSQWELQIHPEFAHPDSSQYTVRTADVSDRAMLHHSPDSEIPDSKSDRILGRHSTVAVYIPSVSGARFWLRYSIVEAAAAISPWYYFKLFMNGRHITSWGANSLTQPNGQVMRGLFDPSERWNYKDNGTVYKHNGTEVRPFFFAKEDWERSAAEEGGLIEVMVFRAQDCKRRLPKPESFRTQDQWGIVMPTGGLLEKPQDAKFYDWHLRDPKERPFATFQFHYRSWDSLISLQLIPSDHGRNLLPASPSLLSLNGHPREMQESPQENEGSEIKICVDEVQKESESRDSTSSINSNNPWITTVFEDSPDPGAKNPDKPAALFNVPRTTSSYPLRQTEFDVPRSKFSQSTLNENDEEGESEDDGYEEPVKRPPPPQAPCWVDFLDHPLPEIPTRSTSLNRGNHSRASSTVSNPVSITPSLRSYFDRDAASPEPPVVGVATVMYVVASTFGLNDDPEKKDRDLRSSEEPYYDALSDHEAAPTMTPSRRPVGGVFDLPNITLRQHRIYSPTKPLPPIKQSPILDSETSQSIEEDSGIAGHDSSDGNDGDAEPSILDNNTTTLSLSESEWMCRTPSPVRNDPERDRVEHLWSPTMEKHSFRNSLDGRKKAANVSVEATEELEDRTLVVEGQDNGGVKMRSGNWI